MLSHWIVGGVAKLHSPVYIYQIIFSIKTYYQEYAKQQQNAVSIEQCPFSPYGGRYHTKASSQDLISSPLGKKLQTVSISSITPQTLHCFVS